MNDALPQAPPDWICEDGADCMEIHPSLSPWVGLTPCSQDAAHPSGGDNSRGNAEDANGKFH